MTVAAVSPLAKRPRIETDGAAAASAAGSAGAAAAAGAGNGARQGAYQGALLNTRVLNSKESDTKQNQINKWAEILYLPNQYAGSRILTFLDPRSGDACALTCKRWHVLRTSDAVSRPLIAAHFDVLFAQQQDAQIMEGTYWNHYSACRDAYRKIYPTCQKLAYQTPIPLINFSAPPTPDSQGRFAEALPSDPGVVCPSCVLRSKECRLEMDVAMASFVKREPVAEANPPANPPPPIYDSHLQIRAVSNVCFFEASHEGKVVSIESSPSSDILAMLMEDGMIVLWDIVGRCEMGVLPYTHPSILATAAKATANTATALAVPVAALASALAAAPAAQAAAAAADLAPPPSPEKAVKMWFLDDTTLLAVYRNGVTCVWTYTWEPATQSPATQSFVCQPDCISLALYNITDILCNPNASIKIFHAEDKRAPGHFVLLIFENNQHPLMFPLGQLKMISWTFLSDRRLALAFDDKTDPTISNIATLDLANLENLTLQPLMNKLYNVLSMTVGIGGKVLFVSCRHSNPHTQQVENYIVQFDLITNNFIHHPENNSSSLLQRAIEGEEPVLVRTIRTLPELLAVSRGVMQMVGIINFMPKEFETLFCTDTPIPLPQKASAAAAGSAGSATAAAAAAGPAVGSKRKKTSSN